MVAMSNFITDPKLLKDKAFNASVEVFLCGPGYDNVSHDLRQKIRDHLQIESKVKVIFGEEIEKKRIRGSKVDLQTLEATYAHEADFTLLMLDSPGSIAELGTFSMIENIRPRLFVLVPEKFYGAESYIARGPLSLIASGHRNNIIYYKNDDFDHVVQKISLPVQMYKYAIAEASSTMYHLRNLHRKDSFFTDKYDVHFSPIRIRYYAALVLMAINILHLPRYAEIINILNLSPAIVTESLKVLHETNKIQKINNAQYLAVNNYSDGLLKAFNTTSISELKARIMAYA